MMPWLSALFLVAGATLCLLAAVGVLRLPDFFMRMHAATKAGVVGCGLVLIGAALADGTAGTWIKVMVALVFLLLTTPIAGHLIGRAAYVGGAPLWQGTASDDLQPILPRGSFETGGSRSSAGDPWRISDDTVVLALAKGPQMQAAVRQAIVLARERNVELCGIAIIDVPRLDLRIRIARQAAADVIEQFEEMARRSGVRWVVRLEEGRPAKILSRLSQSACTLAVAPVGWFDQGVLDLEVNVERRLRWSGLRKGIVVLGAQADNVAG